MHYSLHSCLLPKHCILLHGEGFSICKPVMIGVRVTNNENHWSSFCLPFFCSFLKINQLHTSLQKLKTHPPAYSLELQDTSETPSQPRTVSIFGSHNFSLSVRCFSSLCLSYYLQGSDPTTTFMIVINFDACAIHSSSHVRTGQSHSRTSI